jgi:tetratricopeptide (TPR) repeat protein
LPSVQIPFFSSVARAVKQGASSTSSFFLLPSAFLILFVLLAYTPIWHAGFLWDDDVMLTANPCIVGPLGLKEIWTTNAADICPLTTTTLWLEHALWGLAPVPYHLANILMHAACAILLWRVLRSLHVQGAWLGASLWALHPVQVESVAWITEMKNTESGLFFLLSILFFVKWLNFGRVASPPSRHRGATAEIRSYRAYILSLLLAGLAMASKSSTVILPVVLCLCAWWIERRWNWRNLARVMPMLLMSVAASALSIWTQTLQPGLQTDPQWVRPWPQRLATAGDAVWFYLGKLLWPHPLITVYPRWQIDAGQWISYLPLAGVILLFSILWLNRRPGVAGLRACFFAFAYFLVALLPVLGLIDPFISRYSLVFDHFQYLASMGPLALAGAGFAWSWKKRIGVSACRGIGVGTGISKDKILTRMGPALRTPDNKSLRDLRGLLWKFFLVPSAHTANQIQILASKNLWLRQALCAGLLSVLGFVTWHRTWAYQSEEMLWRDTIAKNPDCWLGRYNVGNAYMQKGRLDEAIAQYRKALEINAHYADARNNLGNAFFRKGELDAAIAEYQKTLAIDPNLAETHTNLGNALFQKRQLDAAIEQYGFAVKVNPNYAQAHGNLGVAYFQQGQMDAAIAQYQQALIINPNYAEARTNLGNALLRKGQPDAAIAEYEQAVKTSPTYAIAHANFGVALLQKGQVDQAITEFQEALQLNPNLRPVRDLLAKAMERK